MLQVIYEDNHIIVINKACGIVVQGDKTGDTTLIDIVKDYLKNKYNKPGNVFLGLPHRLDRPTSGIVVLAKTGKTGRAGWTGYGQFDHGNNPCNMSG